MSTAPDAPVLGVLETLRVTLTGALPEGLTWDAVTGATPSAGRRSMSCTSMRPTTS